MLPTAVPPPPKPLRNIMLLNKCLLPASTYLYV